MSFPTGNPDTLTITVDPTGADDLCVVVYCNNVSSNPADAIVIDDTGVGGGAEQVTVGNIAAGTTLIFGGRLFRLAQRLLVPAALIR